MAFFTSVPNFFSNFISADRDSLAAQLGGIFEGILGFLKIPTQLDRYFFACFFLGPVVSSCQQAEPLPPPRPPGWVSQHLSPASPRAPPEEGVLKRLLIEAFPIAFLLGNRYFSLFFLLQPIKQLKFLCLGGRWIPVPPNKFACGPFLAKVACREPLNTCQVP